MTLLGMDQAQSAVADKVWTLGLQGMASGATAEAHCAAIEQPSIDDLTWGHSSGTRGMHRLPRSGRSPVMISCSTTPKLRLQGAGGGEDNKG